MQLNNMEIRTAIAKKRLKYFEVAAALDINPATLSRWLQNELSPTRKKEVLNAIRSIKV